MTLHQCRILLDKVHNLVRFVQEASESEREALILTGVLASSQLGVLEFIEANHPQLLTEADWPTCRQHFLL
jgi:hypothetical protein